MPSVSVLPIAGASYSMRVSGRENTGPVAGEDQFRKSFRALRREARPEERHRPLRQFIACGEILRLGDANDPDFNSTGCKSLCDVKTVEYGNLGHAFHADLLAVVNEVREDEVVVAAYQPNAVRRSEVGQSKTDERDSSPRKPTRHALLSLYLHDEVCRLPQDSVKKSEVIELA